MNTIQIDHETRVTVGYDELGGDNPATWFGDSAVFHWLDNGHADDNVNDADAIAIRRAMPYDATPGDVFEALRKHYGRAGYETGYMHTSARDYRPAFLAVKPGYGTPKMLAEEMNAYFNGEVYKIAVETRTTWVSSDGRVKYEWETADVMGGFYVDPYDDAEILANARFYFDL